LLLASESLANEYNFLLVTDLTRSFNLFPALRRAFLRLENLFIIDSNFTLPRAFLDWLFHSCHAYLNPSQAEGFGLPILEAMAAGKPVITCLYPPITELVDASMAFGFWPSKPMRIACSFGQIWKLGFYKAKSLASQILKAASNEDLVRRKGRKAKQRARLFEYRRVFAAFKAIFKQDLAFRHGKESNPGHGKELGSLSYKDLSGSAYKKFSVNIPTQFLKILNLGCGLNKLPGAVNLDIDQRFKPDIVHDLEQPLPFKDNTFQVIQAYHVLEHIHNLKQLMAELWRVLKPSGLLRIKVPPRDHAVAYQDPTHVRYFDLDTFDYFTRTPGRLEERKILLDNRFWAILKKARVSPTELYFELTPIKQPKQG